MGEDVLHVINFQNSRDLDTIEVSLEIPTPQPTDDAVSA